MLLHAHTCHYASHVNKATMLFTCYLVYLPTISSAENINALNHVKNISIMNLLTFTNFQFIFPIFHRFIQIPNVSYTSLQHNLTDLDAFDTQKSFTLLELKLEQCVA